MAGKIGGPQMMAVIIVPMNRQEGGPQGGPGARDAAQKAPGFGGENNPFGFGQPQGLEDGGDCPGCGAQPQKLGGPGDLGGEQGPGMNQDLMKMLAMFVAELIKNLMNGQQNPGMMAGGQKEGGQDPFKQLNQQVFA